MKIIKAEFVSFSDATIHYLHKAIGVYVIWSSLDARHPKYIGRGKLLQRLADSEKRCPSVWEGTVCVLGYGFDSAAEKEACILENTLLMIADQTNRFPRDNSAIEYKRAIKTILAHNQVRINFTGRNPLYPPNRSEMATRQQVTLFYDDEDDSLEIEHNWRC